MNETIIAVVFALLVGVGFGAAVGYSTSEAAWRRDCKHLGAHFFDGKVYDCKERP